MILTLIGIAAAGAGGVYTFTKGVRVKGGQLGQPGLGPKWRTRWAVNRWIGEVWNPRDGWRSVGDFDTPELAKGAAIAKAMLYLSQPALTATIATHKAIDFSSQDV
jgi:hypothetical protein